ncbi:unnamed protein product [Caenorhabditis sp. 36 PRJEB53466]|nr:unnamed protein product [Caenorhabditis sp. 36 PRJEB53466]
MRAGWALGNQERNLNDSSSAERCTSAKTSRRSSKRSDWRAAPSEFSPPPQFFGFSPWASPRATSSTPKTTDD